MFKKKSEGLVKPKKIDNSTMLGDMKGYIDKYNHALSTAAAWKTIAFTLAIALIMAIGGLTYIGSKSKYIPMVFYTDNSGAMQFGGVVSENLRITEPMIANQMNDYLVALRQIPKDIEIKNEYMAKVKMMSTTQVFDNIVIPMIKDRYTANIDQTIKVKVRNVLPIAKDTYQIDWDEILNQKVIGRFKGSFKFALNPDLNDPVVKLYDPLGIVVSDININQEVQQ